MNEIKLRDYQINIVNIAITHFKLNNKAMLNMCCGAGKTITSLSIAKELNSNKILILVPSTILLQQWMLNTSKIFKNKKIVKFSKKTNEFDILISTYHNSNNIKNLNITFNLIILDECHHLTGDLNKLNKKSFLHTFSLKSEKQLSLTATIKKNNNDNLIDNTSIESFGNIIAKYNIEWGVTNKIISDFDIQLLILNMNSLSDLIIKKNKLDKIDNSLYFSAYMALYNLNNSTSSNILIYANKIANAEIIISYIDLLLSKKIIKLNKNIKIHNCSSKSKFTIADFDKNICNILVSVYSLGEGFDLPELDTVIFAENMISNIRIIQSMLRPCRIYPNKNKALIILPIICNNHIATNDDFKKIKLILNSLNNHDSDIAKYYFSKISGSELIKNNLKKYSLVNYDLNTVNKFLNNILTSNNQFSIVEYN